MTLDGERGGAAQAQCDWVVLSACNTAAGNKPALKRGQGSKVQFAGLQQTVSGSAAAAVSVVLQSAELAVRIRMAQERASLDQRETGH